MRLEELLKAWRGGLIVSCQAPKESPLNRPEIIAALALTAERNGAVGVRIDGAENIRAVREAGVRVPIIGIEKRVYENSDVYITPTYDSARRIGESGANTVAIDGTKRARPLNETVREIVARIHTELACPVMADIATYEEGVSAAEEAGADFVGTTLAGYTAETKSLEGAAFDLVERLASRVNVPVICEGRVRSPADVRRALDCGAFAVVVGNAITGVDSLVQQFVAATVKSRG